MINTLFLTTYLLNLLFLLPFSTHKHISMASRAILSIFFEEQWTQNHPKPFGIVVYTFLEIAIIIYSTYFLTYIVQFCILGGINSTKYFIQLYLFQEYYYQYYFCKSDYIIMLPLHFLSYPKILHNIMKTWFLPFTAILLSN